MLNREKLYISTVLKEGFEGDGAGQRGVLSRLFEDVCGRIRHSAIDQQSKEAGLKGLQGGSHLGPSK